jgi:hypothetical protein
MILLDDVLVCWSHTVIVLLDSAATAFETTADNENSSAVAPIMDRALKKAGYAMFVSPLLWIFEKSPELNVSLNVSEC